jgi:hypothetical protein
MVSDHGIVHHDGPHPNQHMVFDGAAVDNGVVADAHLITNDGAGLLVCTVDHGPVLDIDHISDAYRIDIAPDDRVEPYTAVISKDYVSNNGGVRGDIAVFAELRRNAFYGQDNWHLT